MTTCTWNFRRHAARIGVTAGFLAASCGVVAPSTASADQLTSLKAQAQDVAGRIQVLGTQEAALSEQYDGATIALQKAQEQVGQATRDLSAANVKTAKAKATLRVEAVNAYVHNGAAGASGSGTSLGNADQSLLRAEYVSSMTSNESDAQDQYHLAALQAATARINLEAAQNAAQQRVATLASDRRQVADSQSQLQAVYNQDQGQIATLVAQIQAQQEAAARAAAVAAANARAEAQAAAARAAAVAQASAAPTTASPPTASPSTAGPATSSPALDSSPVTPPPAHYGGVIAAAESRLGDPYVYGAAGPGEFDCSGLVQWAFAQIGVSLPHYSGAQYSAGVQIPMSDLQPGDLVFFSNPGDHVAIYIGGGQIIEAPHTGDVVHIVPMYSSFVLAVRIA